MVVTQLIGGLGNQFFQYAAGMALAQRLGRPFALDISHYAGPQRTAEFARFPRSFKLANFRISAPIATADEIYQVRDRRRANPLNRTIRSLARRISPRLLASLHRGIYLEPAEFKYDPNWPNIRRNVYLSGCWQNVKYLEPLEQKLREEFKPRDQSLTARAKAKTAELRQALAPGKPLIALHVRRGDLAHGTEVLKSKSLYGPPVSIQYIEAAAARFDPQSAFAVFSDDPEWCKANIRLANFHVVEGQSDLEDFATMQACDHFIISNSTFSWWAAWLCENPDKRIIAPRQWAYDEVHPDFEVRDLIPAAWEVI